MEKVKLREKSINGQSTRVVEFLVRSKDSYLCGYQ